MCLVPLNKLQFSQLLFPKNVLLILVVRSTPGVWLVSSGLCEGQSIYSCVFPEPQQPSSPTLSERSQNKGHILSEQSRIKSVCVCVCESEGTLFSKHRDICASIKLNSPFVFVSHFFLHFSVCECLSYATPPMTGEYPPDFMPHCSLENFVLHKGPISRSSLQKIIHQNMTQWVKVCIVTDSLRVFCPSFDSWEQASTVTRGSHVSCHIIIIST